MGSRYRGTRDTAWERENRPTGGTGHNDTLGAAAKRRMEEVIRDSRGRSIMDVMCDLSAIAYEGREGAGKANGRGRK